MFFCVTIECGDIICLYIFFIFCQLGFYIILTFIKCIFFNLLPRMVLEMKTAIALDGAGPGAMEGEGGLQHCHFETKSENLVLVNEKCLLLKDDF
jgi:hypothetical protein